VKQGSWNRPSWFLALLCIAFYLCLAFWLYGVWIPGLDAGEACGGSWDQEYWLEHSGEVEQIFPLSVPCSATVNLIPGWLNPVLALLAALAAIGLIGTVVTATTRLLASGRDNPTRESIEPTSQTLELEDR
jgi:hypothetical protein